MYGKETTGATVGTMLNCIALSFFIEQHLCNSLKRLYAMAAR